MNVPRPIARWLLNRANALMASRRHDFAVGGEKSPYLLRWWVIPRNPLLNVYLHRFLRDDDDRALHDHPWVSCSVILDGGYWEHLGERIRVWRAPGCLRLRRARSAHRIALARDWQGGPEPERRRPAITLFLTGPRLRRWGFHCPQEWVHWRDFVASDDKGAVGRGCGEP